MTQSLIYTLAEWIAYTGVVVVTLGVVVTLIRLLIFLATGFNEERARVLRHALMVYLSLGLDFLIAKDVILTLALEVGDYQGVIQLAIVIGVRILLSYFVHLEEKVLKTGLPKKKKKKKA